MCTKDKGMAVAQKTEEENRFMMWSSPVDLY